MYMLPLHVHTSLQNAHQRGNVVCKIIFTIQVILQWKVWVMTMLLQHTACSFQGKCCILHDWPKKKLRKRGNKDGALRAFYQLETEGLAKVLEVGCGSQGTSGVRGAEWYWNSSLLNNWIPAYLILEFQPTWYMYGWLDITQCRVANCDHQFPYSTPCSNTNSRRSRS